MTDKILHEALGDKQRDFKSDPLTQVEVQAVIRYCEKECKRHDLDPDLKEVYAAAIDVLREHVIH